MCQLDCGGQDEAEGLSFAPLQLDAAFRRAYPIVAIEELEGRLRVLTKRDGRGFEARPAQRWELPVLVEQEYPQ